MTENGHSYLDIRFYDSARLDLIKTYEFVTQIIGLFSKKAYSIWFDLKKMFFWLSN